MAGQTIVISVLADTKKLAGGLNEAGGMLSGLGNLAATGAKVAAGALAGLAAAAGAVGFKAVGSASELEQSLGAMAAVFKDSNGQMLTWANGAASAVGLAKSEYAGLATVLGAQLKNMGVSQDQLGGQTNKLIGLGADLAAQFGGSTSDAVSALSSLLRGERDPIERYGVSINQAAIDAKLAQMGLAGLTGEAAKNAQLQATLAILFQQTADAQGAFSRESTTLAGAQQRLSAGTENLFATLGTSLLPAVTAVTAALGALITKVQESAAFQALTGWLTEASNSFADFVFKLINGQGSLDFSGILTAIQSGISSALAWLSGGGLASIFTTLSNARDGILQAAMQAFPGILDALVQLAPQVVQSLVGLIGQIVTFLTGNTAALLNAAMQMLTGLITAATQIIPQLITAITALLPQVLTALVGMIPTLLNGAVSLFKSLVDAIPVVLPSLITALVTLIPQLIGAILGMVPQLLEAAVSLFTSLVNAIPVILPMLIEALVTLIPKIIETIVNMIPKLIDAAVNLFTSLVNAIPIILPMLIEALLDLIPKIIDALLNAIPKLIEGAVSLFTGIVTAVPKILPKLIPALIGLIPKIVETLLSLIPRLIEAGINLIGGLIQGLIQAGSAVGEALLSIAKSAIGGFLSFLGIHSPSRLFAGYGKYLIQGLVGGIDGNRGLVTRSLDALADTVGSFDAQLSTTPSGALSARTVTSVPMRTSPGIGAQGGVYGVGDLSAASIDRLARAIAYYSKDPGITERSIQRATLAANMASSAQGRS